MKYVEASEGNCSCCEHLGSRQIGDRASDSAEYCKVYERIDEFGKYVNLDTIEEKMAFSRDESLIVKQYKSSRVACLDCKPRIGKTLAKLIAEMDTY